MAASITDWKSKSLRYVGTFVNPVNVTISAFPGDGTAKVLLTTKTDGAKVLAANGTVTKTFPPEAGNVVYSLAQREGQWAVETIKAAA